MKVVEEALPPKEKLIEYVEHQSFYLHLGELDHTLSLMSWGI